MVRILWRIVELCMAVVPSREGREAAVTGASVLTQLNTLTIGAGQSGAILRRNAINSAQSFAGSNRASKVRACLSSGNILAHSAVTPIAATPPTTTALTGPSTAAIAPARISPNSFDAEMASPDAALTRLLDNADQERT